MLKTVGNRSDFVENRLEIGWTGQETDSGRRAVRWGWTGNILGNILLAWLGGGLGGSMRLKYGARMAPSSFTSGRVGCAWAIVTEVSGSACRLPLAPMKLNFAPVSSYGWTLHSGMIKMCFWQLWKFRYIPKTLLFSDERGSDTNWWWEKPLVVALKHSEGIKHTILFQQQEAYNN
jgi:hypothetical protein